MKPILTIPKLISDQRFLGTYFRYHGIPVYELKKKKESLMTYFRNNLKKKLSSLKSGVGEEDAFKPIWQFYDAMEVFLKDVYECKSICNSEENTQDKEENCFGEFDGEESSSTTEVQNSDAGNSVFQVSLENSNPVTNCKVIQKRRAKNPPELQEADKQMSAAFSTLNSVLQTKKKEDKENDDADLFCNLLAKQLKDFPKDEREEIMYEIHGLILNKRRSCRGRVLQPSISPSIYNRSSSAHSSSSYSNESLSRNIISPDSPIVQQPLYSDTSPSQIIINRPSSSHSSYTIPTPPPQNFNQERSHLTLSVDQQPTVYCYTSPSQMLIERPSSSRSSYITPTLPHNFNQEISQESPFIPNNVQILSQKTFQPGRDNNILLEAFEKATKEQQ